MAWNRWYHINGNTYGTWLRGDPRGWRARHHREHCEGDYKNPRPKGTFDQLYQNSRELMPRGAVRLNDAARQVACREMVAAMQRHTVEVIALAVDDHHYHILARFPKPTDRPGAPGWAWRAPMRKDENLELAIARHFVGIAKKDSARALSDAGLVSQGGAWAKRCRILAVRDRANPLNVYNYIRNHAQRAASIRSLGKGENQVRGL